MGTYLYINDLSAAALAAVCKVTETDVQEFRKLYAGKQADMETLAIGWQAMSEERQAEVCRQAEVITDTFIEKTNANPAYNTLYSFELNGFGKVCSHLCTDYSGENTNPDEITEILCQQRGLFTDDYNAFESLQRGNAIKEITKVYWC